MRKNLSSIVSVEALTAVDLSGEPQATFVHTVYRTPIKPRRFFVPEAVLGRQSAECMSIAHKPTLMLEHK